MGCLKAFRCYRSKAERAPFYQHGHREQKRMEIINMAKAKKELDTFKVLDTAAKKIEEASKIMEKGEDLIEGFAESAESLEKQAENLGLRLGNMLNRL